MLTYVLSVHHVFLVWISLLCYCRHTWGRPPSVSVAANVFQRLCYDNKDGLSAGIIVAGWDKEQGGSVYNIPLGGGLFRQPWAIGGSGSINSTPGMSLGTTPDNEASMRRSML